MLLGRAGLPQRWPSDVVAAASMAHGCGCLFLAEPHRWAIVAVRWAECPDSLVPPAARGCLRRRAPSLPRPVWAVCRSWDWFWTRRALLDRLGWTLCAEASRH